MLPPNPFRYGDPVPPALHIGREDVIRYLLSRLHTMQSTAIVGLPRIGKTSLLRVLSAQARGRLVDAECYAFVRMDCHMLARDHGIPEFWGSVLSDVRESFAQRSAAERIDGWLRQAFSARGLERLFLGFENEGLRVVLFIDEFDTLLAHPRFRTGEFLGLLRSLVSGSGALALVTAGRLSVAEMNRRTDVKSGSPFFNFLVERRLRAFTPEQIDHLLDSYLGEQRTSFDEADRWAIKRFSGGLPFLVQGWAGLLYERLLAGLPLAEAKWDGEFGEVLGGFCRDLLDLLPTPARALLRMLAQERCLSTYSEAQLAQIQWLHDMDLVKWDGKQVDIRSGCLHAFLLKGV